MAGIALRALEKRIRSSEIANPAWPAMGVRHEGYCGDDGCEKPNLAFAIFRPKGVKSTIQNSMGQRKKGIVAP